MSQQNEKEAFERFMKKSGTAERDFLMQHGSYIIREIRIAWIAWQAARAQPIEGANEGKPGQVLHLTEGWIDQPIEGVKADVVERAVCDACDEDFTDQKPCTHSDENGIDLHEICFYKRQSQSLSSIAESIGEPMSAVATAIQKRDHEIAVQFEDGGMMSDWLANELAKAALSALPQPSEQLKWPDGRLMCEVCRCQNNHPRHCYCERLNLQPSAPAGALTEEHPDNIAVNEFASAMRGKLGHKRRQGCGGWDDPAQCSLDYLRQLFYEHFRKGDMVDIANFAMMIWHRERALTAAMAKKAGANGQ